MSGRREAEGEADGLTLLLAEKTITSVADDGEGEIDSDGLEATDGDVDGDMEGDALGPGSDGETEGEIDELMLGEILALGEADGLVEGDKLGEIDNEIEALGYWDGSAWFSSLMHED